MRAICGIQIKDDKNPKALKMMLHLTETFHQFAIANSAHWYGHV